MLVTPATTETARKALSVEPLAPRAPLPRRQEDPANSLTAYLRETLPLDLGELAQDVLDWLDNPAKADAVRQRFTEMHHLLKRDTARCASDAIAQVIEAR